MVIIRNSLKKELAPSDLEAVGIDPGLRPEQIGIAQYVELSNHIASSLR